MELEEIRGQTFTPRDGEENQEINDMPMIEERIQNENGLIETNKTEIRVRVETEVIDDQRLIIAELKALMIKNKTKQYLPLKKVDQRKLRDVIKKVNAMIRHIETVYIIQTNKLAMAAALWVAKEVYRKERQKRIEKKAMVEKKN